MTKEKRYGKPTSVTAHLLTNGRNRPKVLRNVVALNTINHTLLTKVTRNSKNLASM